MRRPVFPFSSPSRGGVHQVSIIALPLLLAVVACDSSTEPQRTFADLNCSIPSSQIFDGGVGVDGIPALDSPVFVSAESSQADYLRPQDRVIGIIADGEAFAVPHNVLWWHEVVNLDLPDGRRVAVSYCPLTGSSMAFDRGAVGGATIGVSGLIFRNNLIMWDRRDPETLWSQMMAEGICGDEIGKALPMVGVWETTWDGWQKLHPGTQVLGSSQAIGRNYTVGGIHLTGPAI